MDLRTISNFSIALAIIIASLIYAISNKYVPFNYSAKNLPIILNTWNGDLHNTEVIIPKPTKVNSTKAPR